MEDNIWDIVLGISIFLIVLGVMGFFIFYDPPINLSQQLMIAVSVILTIVGSIGAIVVGIIRS